MNAKTTVRPTRRAAAMFGGAVLLFIVGTSVQAGWVLAIAALLLGLLIAGAILGARSLGGVEITRTVPRTASAGQPLPVTINVANTSARPRALLLVSDEFCGRGSALARFVRPGESRSFRGLRTDCRRGVYHGGRTALESGFPFGVLRARRRGTIPSELVVFPKVYTAASRALAGGGAWRAPSPVGDVSSVRDYHVGDPLRNIHWRSVAKRGELVVREFDRERRAEVTVAAFVPEDPDTADAIASIATSLALASLREAGEVVVANQRVRTSDGVLEWGARIDQRTRHSLRNATTSGVICVCPPDEPELDRLPSDRGAFVVLVGPDAATPARKLRGAGVTVAVVDPEEVEAWFNAGCSAS